MKQLFTIHRQTIGIHLTGSTDIYNQGEMTRIDTFLHNSNPGSGTRGAEGVRGGRKEGRYWGRKFPKAKSEGSPPGV
jgi:hypothetical protein